MRILRENSLKVTASVKKIFNVLIYAALQYPFPFAIGNDKMAVPFRFDILA